MPSNRFDVPLPDVVPERDARVVQRYAEYVKSLAIDGFPGLKHWTRNVSRHPNTFHLPTATDRFYPDFVALLEDGRILVVEYKGRDRSPEESRDSREKDLVGRLWAGSFGGRAVFVTATMKAGDPSEITKAVRAALAEANAREA